MLPFQAAPHSIYRVGRVGRTWEFADWKYANEGRFAGRWDDPNGTYRVRYAAFEPVGALVENLQNKRRGLNVVAGQQQIEGDGVLVEPVLRLSWFQEYELGIAQLVLEEVELLDLTTGEGISDIAPGILAAERACGRSSRDFDAATLMRTDRQFTQALGRYVRDSSDFAGIVYRSRFAPELLCVALFEGLHNLSVQVARAIRQTEPDFKRARRIHRLQLALPATPSNPEPPPTTPVSH